MKTIKLQKALLLVSLGAGLLAAGCELVVDFDRTKIPVDIADSGILIDAAGLGGETSTPTGDADAPTEAGSDASDAGDTPDAQQIQDASDAG